MSQFMVWIEYVLELIQSYTSKEVVSINAEDVCFMGGSVRCLTWTTDGIDANKLLICRAELKNF